MTVHAVDAGGQADRGADRPDHRLEARATRWAVISFAVAGVFVALWLLLRGPRAPLAGENGLDTLAGGAAAVFGAAAFCTSFLLESRRGRDAWRSALPRAKRWLDLGALTVAMAMLAYLVVVAVANLFQLGFFGLTVDPFAGGALSGAATAALTYIAVISGGRVTTQGIALLATLVLFMGTMASMLSSPDRSWWQLHFSQLGNSASASGYRFNLALVITGLVATVLANYLGYDIARGLAARGLGERRRTAVFSWLFGVVGICLMIAGLVPDATNTALHVGAASGMVVVFGAYVIGVLRSLPGLSRDFEVFSVASLAGILVGIVLWVPIGYYNLTGTELVVAGILFAWLLVFVRMLSAYARGEDSWRRGTNGRVPVAQAERPAAAGEPE